MHIILTHEQADFDAIASLLGAHLLYEHTLPVLPRKLNRNVRAFLTLYGADLPFIEAQDLNGEPIDMVTLVDTQALVSIKGMTRDMQVHVIDHHPRKDSLPEDWTLNVVETGATATLLLEALREQTDLVLTMPQATLLLLGIYEDTGSLSYIRTTPRDLRAAAFLLEQGASLEIANSFLNHPLTPNQQALYQALSENIEHYTINNHTVLVVTGDARGMDEELSTLAHKLRDQLDPDAIFLLILTRGGVQLIARSTSDNIDVSAIAAHFGGGGHDRAAAGLIRDRDPKDVHDELLEILPQNVRPAITVNQLMSRGAQTLDPDTPVEEVANRMRRYGYEGYPVVRDGAVIGLVTRRAVDRAMSHKLNIPASSLMDAGSFMVRPDDSLEVLQRVMTDSGWGQIPVIDPENGKITGIVTRTDLLKTLTPQRKLPTRLNLASRLEALLPEKHIDFIRKVAKTAHEQQAAVYIVGGFVRDLLLERQSLDFDFVVEGDAIVLAHTLARRNGGRVTAHTRFGTAKWHLPDGYPMESIDLITARMEFYPHPTALPSVERGSIKLDLHRRDFTINTLALRLDGVHYGELHDYWGGLSDIRHGLVRVLHSLSFIDDPTRILRAVRFEQRFDFKIEERTLELLIEARPLLDKVSGDRIRHELDHILIEPQASRMLARLEELGVLKAIHPSLTWDHWLQSRLEGLDEKQPDSSWDLQGWDNEQQMKRDLSYCLWLLRLSPDEALSIARRLMIPAQLKDTILEACELWRDLPDLIDASPSQVVERLDSIHPLSRYAVYRATSDIHLRRNLQLYATHWKQVSPTINGHKLRELGLPPGESYRRILAALRAAWLDGEIKSAEEEQILLEKYLDEFRNKLRKHG